jgi:hypothetical protein
MIDYLHGYIAYPKCRRRRRRPDAYDRSSIKVIELLVMMLGVTSPYI